LNHRRRHLIRTPITGCTPLSFAYGRSAGGHNYSFSRHFNSPYKIIHLSPAPQNIGGQPDIVLADAGGNHLKIHLIGWKPVLIYMLPDIAGKHQPEHLELQLTLHHATILR
jgi:hypothetical protein